MRRVCRRQLFPSQAVLFKMATCSCELRSCGRYECPRLKCQKKVAATGDFCTWCSNGRAYLQVFEKYRFANMALQNLMCHALVLACCGVEVSVASFKLFLAGTLDCARCFAGLTFKGERLKRKAHSEQRGACSCWRDESEEKRLED